MENKKIFVVVVTFKGGQWYDRCFTSLRESSIPVQTIVVDNASDDGTIEYIREHYPEIHLIESKENLGFGRANNLGMRFALDQGCDYVFLLNQDAWVEKDTFEKMINIHSNHPEYGILSPMHLNAEKTGIEKGLVYYLDDRKITDQSLFEDLYFDRIKEVYDTKYVNAAAWLLPKKTLEVVGGFDPIFSHYGEDDNYMHRVLYHKMKIGICPLCIAVHDTVRRITAPDKKVQTNWSSLLAEVTDINKRLTPTGLCLFHFRKTISKLIVFKFSVARYHWETMRFLCKNANAIKKSRRTNVLPGMNWLSDQNINSYANGNERV